MAANLENGKLAPEGASKFTNGRPASKGYESISYEDAMVKYGTGRYQLVLFSESCPLYCSRIFHINSVDIMVL